MTTQILTPGVRTLEGSYYEIGRQMGATLRNLEVPKAEKDAVKLAQACEALVRERYPSIVEQVEGMIEGGRLNSKDFKAFFYTRNASPLMGCTNLAVLPSHTGDGTLLVGVNYDWYYYSREWRELRVASPRGAYRNLGVTHHWAGCPDGLNDQGLGVFLSVLPRQNPVGPGFQWHVITQIMLDGCRNAAEACELAASVPHLGAFNYLIADSGGDAVVAEALPTGVTIREAEDGFILATNHLPGREAAEEGLSADDIRRQRRSLSRYARADAVLGAVQGEVDEATVKRLLQDHNAPVCRGNHDPEGGGTGYDDIFGTIWSLIARPQERALQVAWGHPCRSGYVSYALAGRNSEAS